MDNYILLGLSRREVKLMNLKEENGIIKVELVSSKNKVRCPNCNNFTSSVHDVRKPIESKYLDSCGQQVILKITKRRFHCYRCNKTFTEQLSLNTKDGNISNKVKIQIRKDLLDYNLSIKKIAEKNMCQTILLEKS